MGGGVSIELQLASQCRPPALFEQDLRKELPLDASDISTIEQAQQEVSRLRRLGKWMHEQKVGASFLCWLLVCLCGVRGEPFQFLQS